MVSSLTPDPLTYTFPTARRNYQYGPELKHTVNYYPNPTRMGGSGNPWILRVHGGGWGFGDKTGSIEGANIVHIMAAYLLDSVSYGTSDPAFDVFSCEVRLHAYAGTQKSAYQDTLEGTNPGTGPMAYPGYALSWIDDMQRCVQWIKDNIPDIDPSKCILWGESAGGVMSAIAALGPQRHYSNPPVGIWGARSPSNVKGVLNYYAPINMSPWFTSFIETNGDLGLYTSDINATRADYERALLIPNSSGAYPNTSERSPLCKAFSIVDAVARASYDTRSVKIRSMYRTFEETVVPITTYSAIPPYGAHDWRQMAMLQTACDEAGITHTGSLVTGSSQIAHEAVLQGIYENLAAIVG